MLSAWNQLVWNFHFPSGIDAIHHLRATHYAAFRWSVTCDHVGLDARGTNNSYNSDPRNPLFRCPQRPFSKGLRSKSRSFYSLELIQFLHWLISMAWLVIKSPMWLVLWSRQTNCHDSEVSPCSSQKIDLDVQTLHPAKQIGSGRRDGNFWNLNERLQIRNV